MADETAAQKLKTFFFVNSPQHNIQPLQVYLEKKGFGFENKVTLEGAAGRIRELRPDYIFVAWDHPESGLPDFVRQILSEDGIVIPYITSPHAADTSRMAQLTVPLKIVTPLTGPAVERFVAQYEKDKVSIKKQQMNNLLSAASESNFARPARKPRRIQSGLKSLSGQEPDALIFFDSITDLTADKPLVRHGDKASLKINDIQRTVLTKKYIEVIQPELTDFVKTMSIEPTENKFLNTYAQLIHGVNCSGFSIFHSEWPFNIEDVGWALSLWADQLTGEYEKTMVGENSVYQSEIFKVAVPADINLFDLCVKNASVSKNLLLEGKNTAVAFFDVDQNPSNLEASFDPNYLSIRKTALEPNSLLPFDLYLGLSQNRKFLKYFKSGTVMSIKELEAMESKKDSQFCIRMDDEISWLRYALEHHLAHLSKS